MKNKNKIDMCQILPLIDGDWYLWLGFQGRGWLQYSDVEHNFINEGGIVIDKIDTTHLFTPKQVFRHFTNYPTPPNCLKELESKILNKKSVKSLKAGAEYNQLVEQVRANDYTIAVQCGTIAGLQDKNTELKSEIESKDLAIVALLEKLDGMEAIDHTPELTQLNHELTSKLAHATEVAKMWEDKFTKLERDYIGPLAAYIERNHLHDLAIVRCINPDQIHDVFKLYCAKTKQAIHKHSRGRDTRAVYERYEAIPTVSEQLFPNLLQQRAEIVKFEIKDGKYMTANGVELPTDFVLKYPHQIDTHGGWLEIL